MKNLFILFLLLCGLVSPSSAIASHIELQPCIEVSHCVREELNVEKIDSPYEKVKSIISTSNSSLTQWETWIQGCNSTWEAIAEEGVNNPYKSKKRMNKFFIYLKLLLIKIANKNKFYEDNSF